MKRISLFQEILIQITDAGFDRIIEKYGVEFCVWNIYPKHEFHYGGSWYRLSTIFMLRYFGSLDSDFLSCGLINMILIPEDKIQPTDSDVLNEYPFNMVSMPPFFIDPNDDVFNSPIPDYLK